MHKRALAKPATVRYADSVTLRRRIFFVNDDDTVRHIPTARYDRLWDEQPSPLPEYANKRVRVAEVMVECVARDPINLRINAPHFLRFDSTGAINNGELFREAAKYLNIAFAPKGDTAARFMRRRLDHQCRWEVTPLIFSNIADAVLGVGRWGVPPRRSGSRVKFSRRFR